MGTAPREPRRRTLIDTPIQMKGNVHRRSVQGTMMG